MNRESRFPFDSAVCAMSVQLVGLWILKYANCSHLRLDQHDTIFLEMVKTITKVGLHEISAFFATPLRKHNVISLELCRLVIDLMKSNDIMLLQLKLHNPLTGHPLYPFFQQNQPTPVGRYQAEEFNIGSPVAQHIIATRIVLVFSMM